MEQQFLLKRFSNGSIEILDTIHLLRKITFNTGDIVYLREETVIGIVPHDMNGIVLKYLSDAEFLSSTLYLDAIQLPKLSREAETFLNKQEVLTNLKNNEKHYDSVFLAFFKKLSVPITTISKELILRFFNIKETK